MDVKALVTIDLTQHIFLVGNISKTTMCNAAESLSWAVVFAIEFLVIIAGNIITIVIFWKLRALLKRTYYLLLNLTIADLIVGFGATELVTSSIFQLKTTADLKWTRYIPLDVFAGTASVTTLLLIAVERFLAIVFPFRHRVLRKRTYFRCIAGVWATSVLITAITVVPRISENLFFVSFSHWSLACFTTICLVAICCFYITVFVFSRKDNPNIPRDKREQNKRLAKTLFIITVLTLITWIPLAVATLYPPRNEKCVMPSFRFVALFLQLANSALNPLVYCYRMPEFSTTLKRIVQKCSYRKADSRSIQRRLSTDFVELHIVSNLK